MPSMRKRDPQRRALIEEALSNPVVEGRKRTHRQIADEHGCTVRWVEKINQEKRAKLAGQPRSWFACLVDTRNLDAPREACTSNLPSLPSTSNVKPGITIRQISQAELEAHIAPIYKGKRSRRDRRNWMRLRILPKKKPQHEFHGLF